MHCKPYYFALVLIATLVFVSCATHRQPQIAIAVSAALSNNTDDATIQGHVIDISNQPIIAALVIAACSEKARTRTAVTDLDGSFSMHVYAPAVYTMQVDVIGYNRAKAKPIEIQPGSIIIVAAVLPESGERIDLSCPAPAINLKDSSAGVRIINDDNGFPRVETK